MTRLLLTLLLVASLAACERRVPVEPAHASAVQSPASAPTSFYATAFELKPDANALTSLGRQLFGEPALSASGRMACRSCHDPAHAYGPPNARAVQLGGADLTQPGLRAAPSLMYQQDTPPFSEHFNDTDGDDSVDMGPTGGRGWDGRASSAHEQAALPLLSPYEMANADSSSVVANLRASASAAAFRSTFGEHVFDNPALAWNGVLLALEVFQQSPADFYPYTSKYDAYLRRTATLSPSEERGMLLFNDATKGNCANCHVSAIKRGAFPQFTDRGHIAIGVPRNKSIPANADAGYRDLGLCGPLRADFSDRPGYCGLFKTPTLRNVALRGVFFHNGAFTRLQDVVAFYAERDLHPERFYPRDRKGRVLKYDDLPPSAIVNVNTEAPFDRAPGDKPALTSKEIADVVAFLRTLTDGYAPR